MKKFGHGRAWYHNGLHVLSLRGTYSEMATQHGALLKEEIHQGTLPYLGERNSLLLKNAYKFVNKPLLQKLALKAISLAFHKPMIAQTPRHFLEEAHALARAADIPYKYCVESMVQPDTFVLLLRYFVARHFLRHMAGGFPGCTSVVALGNATKSGNLIHARNMDYQVVSKWEAFPTVTFYDPTDHDAKQRFISITTAGVHTAGVTSTNESGITLSTHFHCARNVSPFGVPIQFIGSEVIRKARTLGEAIDIAGSFNRAGTWSFIVSSGKENAAATIEMAHGKLVVRHPDDGLLAHSNHFHDPDLQSGEFLLSASVAGDYSARYRRAMSILKDNHGTIDRNTAARILGDNLDIETGKLRAHGNTIAVITNIKSFISEPLEGKFWVANSHESPVSLGDYVGFNIDEDFHDFESRTPETFTWNADSKASIKDDPRKREALRVFRESYIAHHVNYDLKAAARAAARAAELDPNEGHFQIAAGYLNMRLGQVKEAAAYFRRALNCTLTRHMAQVTSFYLAHTLDATGMREEAVARYKDLVTDAIDPNIRREAKKFLRKPCPIDQAARMTFDMQFCDTLEYV